MTWEHLWFKFYKPKLGDTIFDIGAGRGEDLMMFSGIVGEYGKILAVEAHPIQFQSVEKTKIDNDLQNVIVLNAAVMDTEQTVYINNPDNLETASVSSIGDFKIQAFSLNSIFKMTNLSRIDFLKMNIEGAEIAALNGARQIIDRVQNGIICCHDFLADQGHGEHLRTSHFVKHYLKEANFKTHYDESWGHAFFWREK